MTSTRDCRESKPVRTAIERGGRNNLRKNRQTKKQPLAHALTKNSFFIKRHTGMVFSIPLPGYQSEDEQDDLICSIRRKHCS